MDIQLNPHYFAIATLISATCFTFVWWLDAKTHSSLVKIDISDKELQTHRILILTSGMMELSLILLYWFHWEALALFIAAFITRTAHEFIDELKFHADRCSFKETIFHLIMWMTVLTKTFLLFIWGFFFRYKGIENLPIWIYVWAFLIVVLMALISLKEWNQGKS